MQIRAEHIREKLVPGRSTKQGDQVNVRGGCSLRASSTFLLRASPTPTARRLRGKRPAGSIKPPGRVRVVPPSNAEPRPGTQSCENRWCAAREGAPRRDEREPLPLRRQTRKETRDQTTRGSLRPGCLRRARMAGSSQRQRHEPRHPAASPAARAGTRSSPRWLAMIIGKSPSCSRRPGGEPRGPVRDRRGGHGSRRRSLGRPPFRRRASSSLAAATSEARDRTGCPRSSRASS